MTDEAQQIPEKASVVVVGAGLSGLVAGRDLLRAGIEDFVVIEAQDEVGGRIKSFTRENGLKLEKGAEFTGPSQPTVLAIGEDLGLATS
ncbi:MAG TPA: FAD-dependent oxidoreductase, partial [Baekduia sp.]|nr:FAD-dependent oxidoreductase [Baekduia sp.]